MASFSDQLKQAFTALGQCPTGEVSGRYRMEAALNALPTPDHLTPPAPGRRLIALGIGASLPLAVLEYAASVCRRLQADLLLLCTDPQRLHALISAHQPLLAGIACEAEELPRVNRRNVARVLERRSRVLFAISGTPDDPVRCLVPGKSGLFGGESPVPVVVVGDHQEPPRQPPARFERAAS